MVAIIDATACRACGLGIKVASRVVSDGIELWALAVVVVAGVGAWGNTEGGDKSVAIGSDSGPGAFFTPLAATRGAASTLVAADGARGLGCLAGGDGGANVSVPSAFLGFRLGS